METAELLPATADPTAEKHIPASQRLNHDVLFIIFSHLASFCIGSIIKTGNVCRQWRGVMLSVPQAWTRIDLYASLDLEYINTFLHRSRNLPLHIGIPGDTPDNVTEIISGITARICCLKIADGCRILQQDFPILERLEIGGWRDNKDVGQHEEITWDSSRFPQLKRLCAVSQVPRFLRTRYMGPGPYGTVLQSITQMQIGGFPPLEKLEILCELVHHWIPIIQLCSKTLTSLELFIRDRGHHQEYHLTLPKLRHLKLHGGQQLRFHIIAPHLESLDDASTVREADSQTMVIYRPHIILRHSLTVKHWHTSGHVSDSQRSSWNYSDHSYKYTGIRTLWAECSQQTLNDPNHTFERRRTLVHLYPDLEALRYYCNGKEKVRSAMREYLRDMDWKVSVEEVHVSDVRLPGSMPHSADCREMPCTRYDSFSALRRTAKGPH